MQISSRLTMAVHTLLCIAHFEKSEKVTSSFIAASVGTNPVIIRNLLSQLKAADFIDVKRGTGGGRSNASYLSGRDGRDDGKSYQ